MTGLFGDGVRLHFTRVEVEASLSLIPLDGPLRPDAPLCSTLRMRFCAQEALRDPVFHLVLPEWAEGVLVGCHVWVKTFAGPVSVRAACGGDSGDRGDTDSDEVIHVTDHSWGGSAGDAALRTPTGWRIPVHEALSVPANSVIMVSVTVLTAAVHTARDDTSGALVTTVQLLTCTAAGASCTRALTPQGRPCPGTCCLAGGHWRAELGRGCTEKYHVGPRAGLGINLILRGALSASPKGTADAVHISSPSHDAVHGGLWCYQDTPGLVVRLAAHGSAVGTGSVVILIKRGGRELLAGDGVASTLGRGRPHPLSLGSAHSPSGVGARLVLGQARVQFTLSTRLPVGGSGSGSGTGAAAGGKDGAKSPTVGSAPDRPGDQWMARRREKHAHS